MIRPATRSGRIEPATLIAVTPPTREEHEALARMDRPNATFLPVPKIQAAERTEPLAPISEDADVPETLFEEAV